MDRRRAERQGLLRREKHTLRQAFPTATVTLERDVLTWEEWIQPGPNCQNYHVRITWNGWSRPKIEVLEPVLEPPAGMELEHVFGDDSICLHLPVEWNSTMLIADTIIPWTHKWLVFHEIYLATGEWLGGGHGTDVKEDDDMHAEDSAPRASAG
jgi:hypothetical protein